MMLGTSDSQMFALQTGVDSITALMRHKIGDISDKTIQDMFVQALSVLECQSRQIDILTKEVNEVCLKLNQNLADQTNIGSADTDSMN